MLLLNFSARLKRKKLAATKIVHFLSIYKEQKLVGGVVLQAILFRFVYVRGRLMYCTYSGQHDDS